MEAAAPTKTTTKKPDAAPIVAPVAVPVADKIKTEQKLRAVQPKKFAPSSLQSVGQDYVTMTATAPAEWDYEDCLLPIAWSNVASIVAKDALNTRRDKIGSFIELRSADHSYFALLYILSITVDHMGSPNGLNVMCVGPSVDPKTGKACPIDVRSGTPWVSRKPAE